MDKRTIYTNGRIYTGNPAQPWADTLVIQNGRLLAVGFASDLQRVTQGYAAINLKQKMVMPGIHDAHIHLLLSGLKFGFECRIRPNANSKQLIEDICNCRKCKSGTLSSWVIAGEYNPFAIEKGHLDRKLLDEHFPDRPVFISDYTIHNALVNSKALEIAGLNSDVTDPNGGHFVRREGSSELTGELVERARWAVSAAIPEYSSDIYEDALRWSVSMAHRYGITSVQEASASLPELKALRALDSVDELNLHVAAHLVWQEVTFSGGASLEQQDDLISRHREHLTQHVDTRFVKCWLDGAPLPPHFTESRIDNENKVDLSKIVISEDDLTAALIRLDRDGLTMKMHCAGEGAARVALNAVERMREQNGNQGPFHEIAHAGFIHVDDRGRLAALRVVAEMSPALWHNTSPEFKSLSTGFKFNTMHRLGTQVTVGSDWIITENPNLFPALQGMLLRGEESVDLETALFMMTLAGAKAVGKQDQFGSLEVGKSADFIVLDRNLFEIEKNEVGDTQVLLTVFKGKAVYSADAGFQ
ncbi:MULTISPECIES: amidohydrolase [Pseudomonas]|uniref:Amidohydrolase family protein n=1 Tax=Pseudomonas kurunegalensis TaxID=485880 RepID=A0ACC5UHC1_9PSED|nr:MULTISPECIES: amidohydrolase family protein [Pseudomonas]MBC3421916.1 amidohydrolase family protein [Pseudomonas sp. RW3S2]MBV4513834.1 amidohydrolase family protein [Pseudomonas kurunegalensis]